ncbi:serine/threonine-protein kinase [aff. Roholtiella sp. LEGE 12411]|uniref:serine/threonine-protein kinase n=1 Tax=aff. Roholtiella sp. LEGE 12411 TaxID=1828822 RepID=UPI0018811951|nr:serine/threonine-protein kinase [aff. Roholtiella sp. LEGE 12411]MBE9034688.1 protein kinase [aff. Roholtiella sp. LEGE 12411]
MSLCINPVCPQPNHQNNDENRFCLSCGSQLELLGRYRVMRLLNEETGFSKVYEAYEQDTPKILKVLKEELSNNAEVVELFQQEVTVLEKMNHPSIPHQGSYFHYQTRNGLVLHCIAMEKIDGPNLEQWLKQQQNHSISQEQAIAWLKQLLEILDSVHSKQYLHRDIKPSNVIIRSSHTKQSWGELVLIDFGTARKIAKSCSTQLSNYKDMTAIMSSGYSAPEQMSGEAVPESDLFALGRTFVFLLTGCHPLDMYDIHHNLLHWRNHTIRISPLLLNLIDWLMVSDIEKRPANAQQILHHLEEIERQLIAKTAANVNLVESPKSENLTFPSTNKTFITQQHKYLKKVSARALLTALLVTLGLVSIMALTLWHTKLSSTSKYGQSPIKIGKTNYFPYEKGRDSQGRIAKFNIAILSVEYKWLLGSSFQIKYKDQIISLDLLKLNVEEDIHKIMEAPSEIISVGTACKGDLVVEHRMALERSKQLQLVAKKLFSNSPSVKGYRLLNLGQFQRSDCQDNHDLTAYQQSIIIIGVKQKSPNVILDEALRNRLEQKPFADFRLEDYSLGSAEKFKTIPSNL